MISQLTDVFGKYFLGPLTLSCITSGCPADVAGVPTGLTGGEDGIGGRARPGQPQSQDGVALRARIRSNKGPQGDDISCQDSGAYDIDHICDRIDVDQINRSYLDPQLR